MIILILNEKLLLNQFLVVLIGFNIFLRKIELGINKKKVFLSQFIEFNIKIIHLLI